MPKQKRIRSANTPEEREHQLIALAYDVAEAKMLDGTASSQMITHFLKAGSTKEFIEKKIDNARADLLVEQKKSLVDAGDVKKMFADALEAITSYKSTSMEEEIIDED